MEWYRIGRTPLILGHEISGVIEDIGKEAGPYKMGQRIACAHHVPCGRCHYCLNGHETVCDTLRKTNFDPGGFSEYLRLPKINVDYGVFPLPDSVSFEEGTFVEPLACVMRGQRLAGMRPGQTVLVVGSGIAGLLHIQLAKFRGAAHIIATDILDYRLQAAGRFGAEISIQSKDYSPDIIKGINSGRLADLVIACTPAPSAIKQALESVERGGTVLFFAPTQKGAKLEIPFNELFWRNEITLTSSYAASPGEYRGALEIIASHKLNIADMVTHRLGLEETGLGFKLVVEAKESIKVIVYPHKRKG